MTDTGNDTIAKKIRKIEGQLNGIRTMYAEGRSCLEVIQQISAVRSALSSVSRDLLSGEASRCARERTPEDFDRILKSLMDIS